MRKALFMIAVSFLLVGAGCSNNSSNIKTTYQTSSRSDNSSETCVIKGNISSSGERIFHLPNCASYDKTRIDEDAGERWFCSEEEARSAGWRKARNCY